MQMGSSTFVVSLPREWIETNKLSKSDDVHFEKRGNDLVVKGKINKEMEVNVDVSSMSYDLIWRHLICSYRKGASIVNVKYDNQRRLKHVMKFIPDLMGWAIVKRNGDSVIIKDIAPIENNDFEDMFSKVFLLILNVSEDTLKGISEKDAEMLKNISYSDYNINKFSNMCIRILNLRGIVYNTNSLYKIVSTLEEISDEYRKLATFFPPKDVNNELLLIFRKTNDLLKMYYDMFYSKNNINIREFHKKANYLLKDFRKFKGQTTKETNAYVTLFTILHLIKSLAEENLVINI